MIMSINYYYAYGFYKKKYTNTLNRYKINKISLLDWCKSSVNSVYFGGVDNFLYIGVLNFVKGVTLL